jgi:glycosyltransferase involved in cell wall biosynthesis
MATVSVTIICKNESLNITECIQSALFADEIIVLDSGSTDNTVSLARKLGAKVIRTDWPGYGIQKNRAIEHSNSDWIFSLDADERIPTSLAKEVLKAIRKEEYKVFDVPRKSLFITRFMKHSGWYPDRTRRLFKKKAAKFCKSQIHESLQTSQDVGHLKEPLIHYSYRDFETVLRKVNQYSSLMAEKKIMAGEGSTSLKKAIFHGMWAFVRTYLIRAGFLDGREGLILAISNAEVVYYRHLKIMQLQAKNTKIGNKKKFK